MTGAACEIAIERDRVPDFEAAERHIAALSLAICERLELYADLHHLRVAYQQRGEELEPAERAPAGMRVWIGNGKGHVVPMGERLSRLRRYGVLAAAGFAGEPVSA